MTMISCKCLIFITHQVERFGMKDLLIGTRYKVQLRLIRFAGIEK